MIFGARRDFKFHSERWLVTNAGPTAGQPHTVLHSQECWKQKNQTNMGTDFLFTPAVVIPVYGIKYMAMGETGSQCWSWRVWWMEKKSIFLNLVNPSPSWIHLCMQLREIITSWLMGFFLWNRLLCWDLKGVHFTGWMICIWLFLSSRFVLGNHLPPLLGMLVPAGPLETFYQQKWNPQKLGHILKCTLLVSDSIIIAKTCTMC